MNTPYKDTMKVDPIMLDRGVFVIDQGEAISKNDEQIVKNKRGFRSVTPWKKKERNSIGINQSEVVHIEPVTTNAPKSILRSPSQSYDSLVLIDHVALNDDRTVNTTASKKVTWDLNVKDAQKKTILKTVADNLKRLAIGLDTNAQKVREKMQCGNMAVAKDFYCPNEGGDILFHACARCVDEFDGGSLGTNDLAEESREEVDTLRGKEQLTESRETSVEETEDRFTGRIESPVPTAMTTVRRKKKKRNTLVYNNSALRHYTRATPVTSPTSSKTTKKVQGGNVVANASPAKLCTKILQSDESYISALTDPSTIPSIPTKKASKRPQKTRRYTTLPAQQSKKGLKRALVKPVKLMVVGFQLKTRKMLTSK